MTLVRQGARLRPGTALVTVGDCCVIAGGLIAAVTGPLALEHGSWLAAYLVLVAGVAQHALGRAPVVLGGRPMPDAEGWALLAAWNLGNVAVVAGTLMEFPALVDAGAVALAAGLVLAWRAVRTADPTARRAARWLYRAALLALLISLPIGIALAHVRAGR